MADEPITTVPDTTPILPETEAEQQAKQEASLSPDELAALEAERRENERKQAEAEELRKSLSLETLAEQVTDLESRVEALEQAASSSSKSSKSSASSSSTTKSSESTATSSQA